MEGGSYKTNTVIDWFKRIGNKLLCKFLIFDIKEFYPSTTESLLRKAFNFCQCTHTSSDDDKAIINHARKSLLFNNQPAWIKRDSGLFNAMMEVYDGTEVCELNYF